MGQKTSKGFTINPEIISQKGQTQFWEACASCGNLVSLVTRPYEIKIQYQDETGERKAQTLKGFESTVFSHEYDHLNGILHMDIAQKTLTLDYEERAALRKKEPYKVISQESEFEN